MSSITTIVAPDIDRNNRSDHLEIVLDNLNRWTGYDLMKEYGFSRSSLAAQIFNADFYLLSHNSDPDPILNYGNNRVLELWEVSWSELTGMYSRETAKSIDRADRAAIMEQVKLQNYISGYNGIRVSKTGKEFKILDVTIWNLFTDRDEPYGQAAWFKSIER
jgi:hypothetical protein